LALIACQPIHILVIPKGLHDVHLPKVKKSLNKTLILLVAVSISECGVIYDMDHNLYIILQTKTTPQYAYIRTPDKAAHLVFCSAGINFVSSHVVAVHGNTFAFPADNLNSVGYSPQSVRQAGQMYQSHRHSIFTHHVKAFSRNSGTLTGLVQSSVPSWSPCLRHEHRPEHLLR
jgi:hypothetical protein